MSTAPLPDLVQATKICACGSFAELWSIDWNHPDKADLAAIRRMALSPGAVLRARRAWTDYREACAIAPELRERDRGKPSTVPFHLSLVVTVAKAFGRDPEWAWFLRYGQLIHYAAALNEGEYGCKWVTEAEEETFERLARRGITGTRRAGGLEVVRRRRR